MKFISDSDCHQNIRWPNTIPYLDASHDVKGGRLGYGLIGYSASPFSLQTNKAFTNQINFSIV